jgi:hypothetical protein
VTYSPADDHDPLFELDPAHGGVSEVDTTRRSPRSITRAMCPQCASLGPTGIVRQGSHLVWRVHNRTLGSGVRIECPAVGVPLCQVPPRTTPGVTTPTCTCGADAA